MFDDYFLESDYEDRYTIQGDIDSEDESYFEEDEMTEEDRTYEIEYFSPHNYTGEH